jgi:hypothetical protein
MRVEDPVATIVNQGWADIESLVASVLPRSAYRGFCVYEDTAPSRSHWCGVEVVGAEKVMPSRHGGLWAQSKEVEGEFSLGQQEVPTIAWESRGGAGQDGQEMILERAYGAFGTVAAMHMRGH